MDPKQKKDTYFTRDRQRSISPVTAYAFCKFVRQRQTTDTSLHTIISHNCILSSSGIFCITITCHIASTKRKIGNGLIVPRLCKLRYRNLRNCVHIQGIILNVLKYDFFSTGLIIVLSITTKFFQILC